MKIEERYKKIAKETPVLFTTYNRIEYTKLSLKVLLESNCGDIYVYDNHSTDSTVQWLKSLKNEKLIINFSSTNKGVSGAMNYYFSQTEKEKYIAKVDNDTLVEKNWLEQLIAVIDPLDLDIVQAKHPILKHTYYTGDFDEWMDTLKRDKNNPEVYYSKYVGGSGIVIRRSSVNEKLDSNWVLGGWDKFQNKHTELRKAFCVGTEIKLLDTENGNLKEIKYPKYYKKTKRKNLTTSQAIDKLIKDNECYREKIEWLEEDRIKREGYIKNLESSQLKLKKENDILKEKLIYKVIWKFKNKFRNK